VVDDNSTKAETSSKIVYWNRSNSINPGGIFYFKAKKEEVEPLPIVEEIIVQEEGVVKKREEGIEAMSEEEVRKMREEVDGVLSTRAQRAELKDVAGGQAEGEARKAFSDGKFYYKVTTSGLRGGEKGYYYQGWLKKGDNYLSTGRMELNLFGEGVLYYTASVDRSDYPKVIVTLEPEDGNEEPAKAVLEGTF